MFKIIVLFLHCYHASASYNPCGQLYLTQSPHKRKNLQVNWNFDCDNPPDTILVTLTDLRLNPNAPILHTVSPNLVRKGFQETSVSMRDVQLPGNWSDIYSNPDLKAKCFDYYIASVKNGAVIHSQCLAVQPSWMSNFAEMRMEDLMIPGTHNSGAYTGAPIFIKNHVLNQDRNFWQQLVYGIRYFDIRIGRYSDGFYINHSFFKCTKLLPELESAANFLRKSPQEVIVLNFYRFPHPKDFPREYHLELLQLVRDTFRDLIYPFYRISNGKGPKLSEFWVSRQRVIVSYRHDQIAREQSWLWPSVRRDWGNIQHLDDLEKYIKSKIMYPVQGNPMHVLMAELTPSYYQFFTHLTRNLKDYAVMVNRELSDWMRENNNSKNVNIIATDYFTGNDIVNVAIETNYKKMNVHPNVG